LSHWSEGLTGVIKKVQGKLFYALITLFFADN
jgi:hypothetical protein